ncbi:hypothetical protein F4778DRAFT_787262 [Xylariomycetidae sp. FL2044]|nr:hypothetical protein F4778DRAFT_787262 [Xylariomycetidae sp. FL2044]
MVSGLVFRPGLAADYWHRQGDIVRAAVALELRLCLINANWILMPTRDRKVLTGHDVKEMRLIWDRIAKAIEIKLAHELFCAAKRVSQLEDMNNGWMNPKKGMNRDGHLSEFVKRATTKGIRIGGYTNK